MTSLYHTKNKKTRTLASSRFEAVCNMLSSAVDRREVLGVAVGEWGDIVFLQCGTQVGLSVEHLARQGDKRNNAVITVLLQGAFSDFQHLTHLLGGVVAFAIHLRFVVCARRTNVVTQCALLHNFISFNCASILRLVVRIVLIGE